MLRLKGTGGVRLEWSIVRICQKKEKEVGESIFEKKFKLKASPFIKDLARIKKIIYF